MASLELVLLVVSSCHSTWHGCFLTLQVEESTGWLLLQEIIEQRVHARLFKSCILLKDNESKLLQGL
jgi:hypothetical protein